MLPKNNQLASYFEAEMLERSRQIPEKGYSGMGYWYGGYPTYISAVSSQYGAMSTATPGDLSKTQAEPDSKISRAAVEAGATTSGIASGESGTAPN